MRRKFRKLRTVQKEKLKEVKLKKRRDKRDNARPYAIASLTENTPNKTWKPGHCQRCNNRGYMRKDCTKKLDQNKIGRNVSELNQLIRNINANVNTVFEDSSQCPCIA